MITYSTKSKFHSLPTCREIRSQEGRLAMRFPVDVTADPALKGGLCTMGLQSILFPKDKP